MLAAMFTFNRGSGRTTNLPATNRLLALTRRAGEIVAGVEGGAGVGEYTGERGGEFGGEEYPRKSAIPQSAGSTFFSMEFDRCRKRSPATPRGFGFGDERDFICEWYF